MSRDRHDELEETVRALAHAIRNPAMTIQMGATALQEGSGEPRIIAKSIQRAVTKICGLLDELSRLAHAGAGERERVDAGRVARSLGVVDAQSAQVYASPQAVWEILEILLDNARRHGSEPIRVESRPGGFAVLDSGEGVPEDEEDRHFEAFTRGRGSDGLGLGLSIARAAARRHGGDLEIKQSADGFCVEAVFPLPPSVE